jgi:hypothetical protein
MNITPEQRYREKGKRLGDAVRLQVPDRVPVMLELSYFPAWYTGLTYEAAFYDYDNWLKANIKTITDFDPDLVHVTAFSPGEALELLEPRPLRWPGHGVSPNDSHQYLELENMKADEYDDFLEDMSDFIVRKHLPRICGAMEAFSKLPQLSSLGFSFRGALSLAEALADPEVADSVKRLQEIGQIQSKWRDKMQSFGEEIDKLGYPRFYPGTAQAPFDSISDFLRGMHGAMKDMFRQPDKLLEACDRVLEDRIKRGIPTVEKNEDCPQLLFMGMHRGSDGFMSVKQFEKFYWPGLKKVLLTVIDAGLTPLIFCEGDWTTRIQFLLELPAGKSIARLDLTDIYKAKEILKGHTAIMGNVPASLLQTGTPDDVKNCCKKLIDDIGKDGGYILTAGSSIDKAKPENIKTMVDFTKEYGVYR